MRTITLSVFWQTDPATREIVEPTGGYRYGSNNCLQQHVRSVLLEVQPGVFGGTVDHATAEHGALLKFLQGEPEVVAAKLLAHFQDCLEAWGDGGTPAEIWVDVTSYPDGGGFETAKPERLASWKHEAIVPVAA